MTYQSQNDLATDPVFRSRTRMCVAEQAEIFVNDDRVEFKQLAYQAIVSLDSTTDQFVPLVAVRPAMSVDSTDPDILAAVQYVWPIIGGRYIPPPIPPLSGP